MSFRFPALLFLTLMLGGCDAVSGNGAGEVAPSRDGTEQHSAQPLTELRFPEGDYVQLFYEDARIQRNVLAGPRLNPSQRRQLEAAVRFRRIEPDEAFTACFVPHHWFRYFDRNGEQTGAVAVCFCCFDARVYGQGVPNPKMGEVIDADHDKLEGLVSDLGVPTDIACTE